MQKMNKYYFNILGHRTEQDLFVRLVDSVTRQVRISSGYFLCSLLFKPQLNSFNLYLQLNVYH